MSATTEQDLTSITTVHFPSNPRNVTGTQYINSGDIELESGQKGVFCTTPEGFVFERVDVIPLQPCDKLKIAVSGDDGQLLGAFEVNGESVKPVTIKGRNKVIEGEFYSSRTIYIENLGESLSNKTKGRIALTFKGYLIEPWR